jgi:acetyl esterase/lipase
MWAVAAGLLVVLLLVGLVSAQPTVVSAAAAPARVLTGIAYAPAEPAGSAGHLLDLYLPPRRAKPAPVVLWSRGSAWFASDGRFGADAVAAQLNPYGYAVAGVSVRSSTSARFPGQLHDIKAAVRFLRANAARYHLDAGRFAAMGESSGGWVAAMAAVTGDVAAFDGRLGVVGPSSRVQAAVSIYPPTDFLRMDATAPPCVPARDRFRVGDCHTDPASPESRLLGCPITTCRDLARRADPATYAGRRVPPVLLLHGRQDVLVPWQQSAHLYQALAAACRDATLVLLPRPGHGVWQRFLTDPTLNAGATVESSRGCRREPSRPVRLDWPYLVGFLDRALRR